MRTVLVAAMAACSLGLAGPALAADPAAQPDIRNVEAPGNLESKYDLDCIGANKVENRYTPTDLYRAVAKCAAAGRYEEGAFLFALAGAYGRFDILRVEDNTAHQAVTVARMQALAGLNHDQQAAFQESIKTALRPENLAAVCREVVRIGPPDYYPRYMVQHGMAALRGANGGDGLLKDFDAKAAWQQALAGYLHCPGF